MRHNPPHKPAVFLRPTPHDGVSVSDEDWSDVFVLGYLTDAQNDTLAPALVIDLVRYGRLVFGKQHYRRFVPAFTLTEDLMRCWIFHRGGGFASESFSVNRNPEMFVAVVVGYALMSRTELGYDPTLTVGNSLLHATLPSSEGIELKHPPFFTTRPMAARGRTCWEARLAGETELNYVCKDAWRGKDYDLEGILLQRVQLAGVEGIVEYISHQDVHIDSVHDDTSGHIMKGLRAQPPHGTATARRTPCH